MAQPMLGGNDAREIDRLRVLYLDAMERILCNTIYADVRIDPGPSSGTYDARTREEGRDWPERAHTMIGVRRLHHLRMCAERVLRDGVPGDFIEAGVWRGGASIMMRAVLEAYGVRDRRVWLADSFRGLPAPNAEKYPADAGLHLEVYPELAVALEEVKRNFGAHALLDERVRFVEGWFADTLHTVPADAFAIIRLDGDLYESTIDALGALYSRLSAGGFAIVDDYGGIPACRAAVDDFRRRNGIDEAIEPIDWTGVCWRKR